MYIPVQSEREHDKAKLEGHIVLGLSLNLYVTLRGKDMANLILFKYGWNAFEWRVSQERKKNLICSYYKLKNKKIFPIPGPGLFPWGGGYLNRAGSPLGLAKEDGGPIKRVLWPWTSGGHYHPLVIGTRNEEAEALNASRAVRAFS